MAEETKNSTADEQELQDIFNDKRWFINDGFGGDGKKYYIDEADIESVKEADWNYAISYNVALKKGIATEAEMTDLLEERNITGKDWKEKQAELQSALEEKTAALLEATDAENKRQLAEELANARDALFNHNQKQSGPLSCTCENLAEDAKMETLAAVMIKDSDGNRVWDSYEAYKGTSNPVLAVRSKFEIMLAMKGLPSDFMNHTPEAIVMKELAEADLAEEAKRLEEKKEDEPVKDDVPKKKKTSKSSKAEAAADNK